MGPSLHKSATYKFPEDKELNCWLIEDRGMHIGFIYPARLSMKESKLKMNNTATEFR